MTAEELKVIIKAETSQLKANVQTAINSLKSLSGQANATNNNLSGLGDTSLDKLNQQLEEQKQKLVEVDAAIKEATTSVKKLKAEWESVSSSFMKIDPSGNLLNKVMGQNPDFANLKAELDAAQQNLDNLLGQQKEIKANIKDTEGLIKSANKSVKQVSQNTSTLGGIFKRFFSIAKLRMMRMLISAIISNISEGIKLLARYDNEMGGINGYNKVLSDMTSKFKQLGANISVALIGALQVIWPILKLIIDALNVIVETFNKFIAALQGKSTYTRANPDYWKNYAAALEESDSSAKKLYHTINGFDELNTFSSSDKTQSVTLPGEMYEEKELEGIWKWISDNNEIFKTVGLLAAAIAKIIEAVKNLTGAFKNKNSALSTQNRLEQTEYGWLTSLAPAFSNVAVAVGALGLAFAAGWALVKGWDWSWLSDKAAEWGKAVEGAGQKVWDWVTETTNAFNTWKESTFSVVSLWATDVVTKIKECLDTNMSNISQWILQTLEAYEGWKIGVQDKIVTLANETYQTLKQWSTNTLNNLNQWIATTSNNISQWATRTANNISVWATNTWSTVKTWASNTAITISSWATQTLNSIQVWMSNTASTIGQWASTTWSTFRTWISTTAVSIGAWATSTATAIGEWATNACYNIAEGLGTAMDNIGNFVSQSWSSIKSWVSSMGSAFSSLASGIVSSIASGLSTAWSNVKNFFSNLKSAFNSGNTGSLNIVSKIQTMGAMLSVVGITTVAALAKKFFNFKGLSLGGYVPAYANGGVITSPTLGLIGEYAGASNNPEIVTPTNLLREIVAEGNSELASVYVQVGRQIISAIENKELQVSISDDAIANSAARGNRAYYKRTGKQLIGV